MGTNRSMLPSVYKNDKDYKQISLFIIMVPLMGLNIRNPEADRLAREPSARTGETITEAVITALGERRNRQTAKQPVDLLETHMEIAHHLSKLRLHTGLSPDEFIGYDQHGLSR